MLTSYKKNSQEEQALGRSKGGFITKIHALVDALGLPIKFILTPGQASEIKQAPELIKNIKSANILGDKAFDCDKLVNQIISQRCVPIIYHHGPIARIQERWITIYTRKDT